MLKILFLTIGLSLPHVLFASFQNFPDPGASLQFKLFNVYKQLDRMGKLVPLKRKNAKKMFKQVFFCEFVKLINGSKYIVVWKGEVLSEVPVDTKSLTSLIKYIDRSIRSDESFYVDIVPYINRVASKITGHVTFLGLDFNNSFAILESGRGRLINNKRVN